MVTDIEKITNIESLFSGKGEQQISPQVLELLGGIISKNLNLNQSKEIQVDFYKLYKSVEDKFENWLDSEFSNNYARSVSNTAKKIFLRSTKSIQDIHNLIEEGYVNKKVGQVCFRVFLNYVEDKELLDEMVILKARKKIRIVNKKNRKINVYVPKTEDIVSSLKILSSGEYPREALFLYRYVLESGCRYTELENFFTEFNKNNIEETENMVAYDNFYIRGKKSSFYLFSSKKTFEKLISLAKKINPEVLTYVKRKIQRDDRVICLKYLRKYNFTKLVQHGIDIELANFIQGRDSQDVGTNYYLGKKTIITPLYSKFINGFTEELY